MVPLPLLPLTVSGKVGASPTLPRVMRAPRRIRYLRPNPRRSAVADRGCVPRRTTQRPYADAGDRMRCTEPNNATMDPTRRTTAAASDATGHDRDDHHGKSMTNA